MPVRATITDFGPVLLSKILDLNDTQESSLGLVFHYADEAGLPLLDLKDLRAVLTWLTSDEGKADLKGLGGLSPATAGVILRELIALEDLGGDVFFGEPAWEPADLLRTAPDGRGVISAVELMAVQDRPALFSTFLMWLLAELFEELPEVGDLDRPKLVFFLDEAHLLFTGASKAFLEAVTQTVRLIRSKGVGVFFVTQNPTDVPSSVLGQLGNRVQHALRTFTPEDADALRKTVRTFPKSTDYDLGDLLTALGTGEAAVTVLSERGAPTPVAATLLRAPRSSMGAIDEQVRSGVVAALPAAGPVRRDRRPGVRLRAARRQAGAAARRRRRTPRSAGAAPGTRAPAGAGAGGAGARGRRGGRRGAGVLGVPGLRPVGRLRPRPRDQPGHLRHASPAVTIGACARLRP